MQFEEDTTIEKFSEKLGFLFSYFLFTTILFAIFYLLKKLPNNWSYLHIMGVTLFIVMIGSIIKRILR